MKQFSLFTKPNERQAQADDEARLQSAMLADIGRCPVCGAGLVEYACHECDEYCPTCSGTGLIMVCPRQGQHRKE